MCARAADRCRNDDNLVEFFRLDKEPRGFDPGTLSPACGTQKWMASDKTLAIPQIDDGIRVCWLGLAQRAIVCCV